MSNVSQRRSSSGEEYAGKTLVGSKKQFVRVWLICVDPTLARMDGSFSLRSCRPLLLITIPVFDRVDSHVAPAATRSHAGRRFCECRARRSWPRAPRWVRRSHRSPDRAAPPGFLFAFEADWHARLLLILGGA